MCLVKGDSHASSNKEYYIQAGNVTICSRVGWYCLAVCR